ncbi:zinc ribbon domain-containing protein [Acholeplasma sp. OttesenSCG-928-E16]|nr:zinc ribbon domain-containing protein [Acholeplasma sp. OttesenSCG-928-E16]
MICPKCNKQIPEGSIFCNSCGEQIDKERISLVRLIKNGFGILFFFLTLVSLFLPLGVASSRTLFSRVNKTTYYQQNITFRLSVFDCIEALTYLNDDKVDSEVFLEICHILEKEVKTETLTKYYNDEPLDKSEIKDLKQAFNKINPLIYLQVREIREVSLSTVFFIYMIAVFLIFAFFSLIAFILFSILDILRPKYGGAVRRTVILNVIYGFFYFFIVVIFNQLIKYELSGSAIMYFVVANIGFLLTFCFKLLKLKGYGRLNARILFKNLVVLVGNIVIVTCMVGSVFSFSYKIEDETFLDLGAYDDEGVSTLFEISNYRNARFDELLSFKDSYEGIIYAINKLPLKDARAVLKDFNSTVSFITSKEVAIEGEDIFRFAEATPYVIVAILILTIIQLFISLSNTYYNEIKHRLLNFILSGFKTIGIVYLLIVSISLVARFNDLAVQFDVPITAGLGASLVISTAISVIVPLFNVSFRIDKRKKEVEQSL